MCHFAATTTTEPSDIIIADRDRLQFRFSSQNETLIGPNRFASIIGLHAKRLAIEAYSLLLWTGSQDDEQAAKMKKSLSSIVMNILNGSGDITAPQVFWIFSSLANDKIVPLNDFYTSILLLLAASAALLIHCRHLLLMVVKIVDRWSCDWSHGWTLN